MADLETVFRVLRGVMEPCAEELERRADSDTEFYVKTRHLERGKPLVFGAA